MINPRSTTFHAPDKKLESNVILHQLHIITKKCGTFLGDGWLEKNRLTLRGLMLSMLIIAVPIIPD